MRLHAATATLLFGSPADVVAGVIRGATVGMQVASEVSNVELAHDRQLEEADCSCSQQAIVDLFEEHTKVLNHIPYMWLGLVDGHSDKIWPNATGFHPLEEYEYAQGAIKGVLDEAVAKLSCLECGDCDLADDPNPPNITHNECCCDAHAIRDIASERMYDMARISLLNLGASDFARVGVDSLAGATKCVICDIARPYDCPVDETNTTTTIEPATTEPTTSGTTGTAESTTSGTTGTAESTTSGTTGTAESTTSGTTGTAESTTSGTTGTADSTTSGTADSTTSGTADSTTSGTADSTTSGTADSTTSGTADSTTSGTTGTADSTTGGTTGTADSTTSGTAESTTVTEATTSTTTIDNSSNAPSMAPSSSPSASPSSSPSASLSAPPSASTSTPPSSVPSSSPSTLPTTSPSTSPSSVPSASPSSAPSSTPSVYYCSAAANPEKAKILHCLDREQTSKSIWTVYFETHKYDNYERYEDDSYNGIGSDEEIGADSNINDMLRRTTCREKLATEEWDMVILEENNVGTTISPETKVWAEANPCSPVVLHDWGSAVFPGFHNNFAITFQEDYAQKRNYTTVIPSGADDSLFGSTCLVNWGGTSFTAAVPELKLLRDESQQWYTYAVGLDAGTNGAVEATGTDGGVDDANAIVRNGNVFGIGFLADTLGGDSQNFFMQCYIPKILCSLEFCTEENSGDYKFTPLEAEEKRMPDLPNPNAKPDSVGTDETQFCNDRAGCDSDGSI